MICPEKTIVHSVINRDDFFDSVQFCLKEYSPRKIPWELPIGRK